MAKIEVFPLIVNERQFTDQAEAAKMLSALAAAAAAAYRLQPVLQTLSRSQNLPDDIGQWTDEHAADLIAAVWPFMRKPEAEARAVIQGAGLAAQLVALADVFPLAQQAIEDATKQGKKHGGAQSN